MRWRIGVGLLCILPVLIGCGASTGPTYPSGGSRSYNTSTSRQTRDSSSQPNGTQRTANALVQPSDLTHIGAFRLPDNCGSDALAYSPRGDAEGQDDGFPGALYVADREGERVAQVEIPEPLTPGSEDVGSLSRAEIVEPFNDVDVWRGKGNAPRVSMAYLPARQTGPKLCLCFATDAADGEQPVASCVLYEPDMSGAQGPWPIGGENSRPVPDYVFEIPQAWAAASARGMRVATGGGREGGAGGQGPSLFAVALEQRGNPAPAGASLDSTALLHYDPPVDGDETGDAMNEYHRSDEWTGGAWLTAEGRTAVVFVGTKGTGECWYGLPDGTAWPDEPPYPDDPDGEVGWWSSGFAAQMLFYDPDDLAAVARGEMKPGEPQPYSTLSLDEALVRSTGSQQKHRVGACAFDGNRSVLYVLEPGGDGDGPLVHAWQVGEAQPRRAGL